MNQKNAKKQARDERAAAATAAGDDLSTLVARGVALNGAIQGVELARRQVEGVLADLRGQARDLDLAVRALQAKAAGAPASETPPEGVS